MEQDFNVNRSFIINCDKLISVNASNNLIIESSYNGIDLSGKSIIFDGHVDLSGVICDNMSISNISEISSNFMYVDNIEVPNSIRLKYNSVNDGYIKNVRVGSNLGNYIGRSDAYFTYINVSGGDSSFNDSLYINKNLRVDGILSISNELLINGINFASIETSFNIYKATIERNFFSAKILTKDISAANISISNDLVVKKTSYINDINIRGQLLNNVLKVQAPFTIDPSEYNNASGTLIINGDLTIKGAKTSIQSSIVEIDDISIRLASKLANILDLSNANAGLTISNVASLKYNGTVWNFSGGQLSVENKKVLLIDDISYAKRTFDLCFNAFKTDFSSSFFRLKRNIDNSYNATYTRSQIDSSFILKSNFDLSWLALKSYIDSSYVSKTQLTISFDTIRTLMDVSYVAKNIYQNTEYQNTVYQNTYERLGQTITNLSGGTNNRWGTCVAINEEGNIFAGTSSTFLRIYKYNDISWVKISPDIYGASAVSLNSAGNIVAISDRSFTNFTGQVSVYRYVIDNSWVKISQFTTVGVADDAISLNSSGTILAVGSPYENATGFYSGSTRVYKYITDGSWVPLGQTISGESAYSYAGYSVSLNSSGSILAIGASYNNNAGGTYSGQVRIYRFTNDTSWVLISQDIDGTSTDDNFGFSVSLNGDGTLVACGAMADPRTGYAKVYKYISDGSWIPQGQTIYGEATNDEFGVAVSLNKQGNILGIGAPYNDGSGNFSGHVRVYTYNDVSWIQIATDIDGDMPNDELGTSIALNGMGNRFVVGAPYSYSAPNTYSGRGYVKVYNYQSIIVSTTSIIIPSSFTNSFNSFTEKLDISYLLNSVFEASHNNIKTNFDISFASINMANIDVSSIVIETINTKHNSQRFGNSLWNIIGQDISSNKKVAISNDGNVVAMSSSNYDTVNAGRVYIYELSYNNWNSLGTNAIVGLSDDELGYSLALSSNGRIVAASSLYKDASAGQVRLFELSNNTNSWIQKGSNVNGPRPASESGYSISLAGNGNRIAIGAWKDNSNGTNAGALRVYDFSASINDWRQQGQTIAGISGSFEGYVTALSSDGQTLASGSILTTISGTNVFISGLVKTFTISGTSWTSKGIINGPDISFGRSIKLSANGNAIVIGSPGSVYTTTISNNTIITGSITNMGQAYVYGYNGGTRWTQLGQALRGISGGDEFGSSVSMSNDGTLISVGSNNNNFNRGHVRVFTYANNYWYQLSNTINGKTSSSRAGLHALCGDGSTLIQSNNTYNTVYGINKTLTLNAPLTTINTTISGDLVVTGKAILKSFRISNKHIFDVSINGYSSHYLASSDTSASIVDYYSNVGSIYNKVLKIDACGNISNYSGLYGGVSDSRLKENIVNCSPKLEDLLKVRVVNYNLKGYDSNKYIGVLAQELEELFPELVVQDNTPERLKSVKYSSFTPMLIKAFQEQQILINNLKARLEELENLNFES
jgi:hypothetical protein